MYKKVKMDNTYMIRFKAQMYDLVLVVLNRIKWTISLSIFQTLSFRSSLKPWLQIQSTWEREFMFDDSRGRLRNVFDHCSIMLWSDHQCWYDKYCKQMDRKVEMFISKPKKKFLLYAPHASKLMILVRLQCDSNDVYLTIIKVKTSRLIIRKQPLNQS